MEVEHAGIQEPLNTLARIPSATLSQCRIISSHPITTPYSKVLDPSMVKLRHYILFATGFKYPKTASSRVPVHATARKP
jgi:hypothetical protein